MDIDFWSAFHGALTTSWMPPLTRAGAREHLRPMLMQRFGARAQPGASALRPRVLLTVPVRVSYTPRASPDIPSHHARSVDSRTPHTVSAHAARHRPRCPSTRNPSNIYPNHGRTPRHHRARAARSPWAIVAWCSCGCSCGLHVDGDNGVDGGVCGGRSGRLAADPSPPVPGPSACSRAPAPSAI